jgi:hypothetical protein
MKKRFFRCALFLVTLMLFATLSQQAFAEEEVSFIGTVSYNGLVTTNDGDLFLIGPNEQGFALERLAGKRVEVIGVVSEIEEELYIFVFEFSVVEGSK